VRIACFTDTYLPEINGVVTSIESHTRLLAERGHELVIYAPKYRAYGDDPPPGVRVERYPSFSFISNKATRVALPSIASVIANLYRFAPDVVHVHTPLSIGVVGILGARSLRLPSVQTYHTYIPDFMQYVELQRLLRLDEFSDRVLNSIIFDRMFESGLWQRILKARDVIEDQGEEFVAEVRRIARAAAGSADGGERPQLSARMAWRYTRTLYNRSDLVLTPSVTLKRELVRHGITVPVEYLSNGIDTSLIAAKSDWSPTGRLVHAGRLGFEKNVDVVVAAFARIAETDATSTLDIIGDGPARESLKRQAAKLGLGERVRFPGFMDRIQLGRLYRDYDCFVTASTIETQGIVLLEAMTAGLPVVGVKALAIPELVRHDVSGLIVPPGDDEALAEALTRILGSHDMRERFGRAGAEAVAEHEVGSVVGKLEALYGGVVKARERRRALLAATDTRGE
jgi:glycosyltransferase involved in cell wall biosynthesis